jgi:hypothetical protein
MRSDANDLDNTGHGNIELIWVIICEWQEESWGEGKI